MKIGGSGAFLAIIKQQLFKKPVKYKAMYGVFLLSLKNVRLHPIFFLNTKSTYFYLMLFYVILFKCFLHFHFIVCPFKRRICVS